MTKTKPSTSSRFKFWTGWIWYPEKVWEPILTSVRVWPRCSRVGTLLRSICPPWLIWPDIMSRRCSKIQLKHHDHSRPSLMLSHNVKILRKILAFESFERFDRFLSSLKSFDEFCHPQYYSNSCFCHLYQASLPAPSYQQDKTVVTKSLNAVVLNAVSYNEAQNSACLQFWWRCWHYVGASNPDSSLCHQRRLSHGENSCWRACERTFSYSVERHSQGPHERFGEVVSNKFWACLLR